MPRRTSKSRKAAGSPPKRPAVQAARPPAEASPAPDAGKAAAPAIPPAKTSATVRSASLKPLLVMALLMFAVAGMLFAVIALIAPTTDKTVRPVPLRTAGLPEPVSKHHEFVFWTSAWAPVIPDLRVEEFALSGESAIDLTPVPASIAPRPEPAELAPPRTSRYVYAPNGKRFVNYLARYGEPTSMVTSYDSADGVTRLLRSCSKPCRFDHAFWITDSLAVVMGIMEAEPGGGKACPVGNWRTCPGKLTVDVYDFAAGTQMRYVSSPRIVSEDPFEALARQRWAGSLTDMEKAEFLPDENVAVSGTLGSIDENGDLLVAKEGDEDSKMFRVTLHAKATFTDERGGETERSYLRPGFGLSLQGRPLGDDAFVAIRAVVTSAPNVIVSRPEPQSNVGLTFTVTGEARTFENTVNFRVRNTRTGRIAAETFTTAEAAEAGHYGRYSAEISLTPARVRTGDPLMLEAFQYSAEDGSMLDLVKVPLRYSP